MTRSTLTLCVLGLLLAVPNTKAVLTQMASVSVSGGNSAKLSCTLSAGTSISSAHVSWLQQKSGNPPRYLLYCKDESSEGLALGASNRFSATKEASTNTCYLAISAVEAEDEASYYCLTSSGGE
ncbi:Pre-B lymphocyte protein 3 [Chelonia mydas]|uniref:Pre-B lymphocyte protein 3 n=1 Tax=Chelonia mydas TaxID=8469 RepID=M7B2K8_CHEMY|nr:Pre-B lymphocyte protein 3 [Chelonia mydas]